MTRKIVFRTDASLEIGSGHVTRCLTLATSLSRLGARCAFVCREHSGHLCDRIEARGFTVARLSNVRRNLAGQARSLPHANWLGASQLDDADETLAAIASLDGVPDWIVADHYGIGAAWERRVRSGAGRVMVIDDLADREHDCDVLLDQNLVAESERRYDGLVSEDCLRLLGPHFALLQADYLQFPQSAGADAAVRRILIYFGGADRGHLTSKTVRSLMTQRDTPFEVDVVLDRRSDQYDGLTRSLAGRQNFNIHSDLPSLAPLLATAGIAIGASGASSWERLYFGVPSIVIPIADNQMPLAAELERQKFAIVVDANDLVQERLEPIVERAFAARSQNQLAPARGLVDGRGSERVATSLCAASDMPLDLRPAQARDEAILLVWANDLETRRNAFNSEPISADGHAAWFAKKLAAPSDCRIFVLETQAGLPIGQIRFDRVDSAWTIGYSLASHMRGQRLGARLIALGLTALRDAVGRCSVIGLVKPENMPSRRAFLRCGFSEMLHADENHVEFRQA